MVQQKTLGCGSLANATGVSPDTIRHYERLGVLPRAARTQSGYRIYPEAAIDRVLVVQKALRVGFSLGELAEVLKARDAGGVPCRRVYQLAEEKLRDIEENINTLRRTAKYLKTILRDWKQKMQRSGPKQQAHLLHSLSDALRSTAAQSKNSWRKRKS
jgi:DNA-binding transcriptional MerR regulator